MSNKKKKTELEDLVRSLIRYTERPLKNTRGLLICEGKTNCAEYSDIINSLKIVEDIKELIGYKKDEKTELEQIEIPFA